MALSIDWSERIISVPKADMLLVQSIPTEIRQLNLDAFRLELKDIEDSDDGIVNPTTHNHVAPISVGGVTLARVIELINGYTVTFEDGQYAVNLVGANSNIGDNVNVNQVSVRSANSAGLTYSKQVEDQSFAPIKVFIDTINGRSGTQFPRGTPGDPVNSFEDALAIITARTLPKSIHLRGALVLDPADDVGGFDIQGDSVLLASLDLGGASTENLHITGVAVTGVANGTIAANGSAAFENVTNFEGQMIGCGLAGTVDLAPDGGDPNAYYFIDCYALEPDTVTPVIDCDNISNAEVSIRNYHGTLVLRNVTDANARVCIDGVVWVVVESSCTAGIICLRGHGHLIDNSGGTTVETDGWIEAPDTAKARKLGTNFVTITVNPDSSKTVTVYDDDSATVLHTYTVAADALTRTPA